MQKSIRNLLSRGVEEIIVAKDLEKKLMSGKKLRIKYGVDPTKPDIHLGHTVALWKLKTLQDLGHSIIFLIGDYTTKIGDPSERNTTRPILTDKEIKINARTYFKQVGKILNIDKTEICYNSEWFSKIKFDELLKILGKFTVAQIIERDDFQKRLKRGADIALQELLYPVMQAYDSIILKSDIAFCGADQKFNELAGRELQKKMKQKPQDVLMVDLLVGLDGKIKMSKSANNYISITESPKEQFGKIMSIPDKLIYQYFELATQISDKELEKIKKELAKTDNPKNLKVRLAKEIVKMYHNEEEANNAEAEFNRVFVNRETPFDIPEVKIKKPVCESLASLLVDIKLAPSKTEARRLISQGAVKIDNAKITEDKENLCLHNNMIIKVGKRRFIKIKFEARSTKSETLRLRSG